ncbi:hypothetical protein [Runella sp.]|uniref:hypothetical protein n=1 Tax=Runella sp. TaxID=1960881 RepID=UPI00301A425A
MGKYVEFSTNGAKLFLERIKECFPKFYHNITGEVFSDENLSESRYWRVVGEFLSGESKETVGSRYAELRYFEKNPLKNAPLLSNFSILYKDIYRYAYLNDGKLKGKIKTETIKGVFAFLFEEKYRNELDYTNNYNDAIYPEAIHERAILKQNNWALYCFWEQSELKNEDSLLKKYGIKESLVEFKENIIEIGNINRKGEKNSYTGEYKIVKNKEGGIYLETKPLRVNENQRYLRLILFFNKDQINQIALGVYYNVREEGTLFCGTALLLKLDNKEKIDTLKKYKCIIHDEIKGLETKIDNAIIDFLERRDQNFIKIPKGLGKFTLEELGKTIEKVRERGINKDVRLYRFDYFLSVPLTYNNSSEESAEVTYQTNRNLSVKLSEMLQKFGLKTKYSTCEHTDISKNYKQFIRPGIYEKTFEAIAKSKYFVLLYPKMKYPNEKDKIRLSSSLTELGYAYGLGKKIILLLR